MKIVTRMQIQELRKGVMKKFALTLKEGASAKVCNDFEKANAKWMDAWKFFLLQEHLKNKKNENNN